MEIQGVDLPVSEPGSAAKYIRETNERRAKPGNVTHTVTTEAPKPPVVEPPAEPVEPVETKTEPAAETKDEKWIDPETQDEIPGKPSRYQRRLSKMWQERESERQMRVDAERRLADAEARLAARPAAPATSEPEAAADDDQALTMAAQSRIRPKPDRTAIGSKYATYEDYVEDCAIWGGELAAEKRAIKTDSMQAQTAQERARSAFAHERETAKADYPDFDQVTNQNIALNQAIADAVINAPTGLKGHVQYWLGKHPDETARIAALPHEAALIEMGIVIATVKAERTAKAKPADPQKQKPKSDAPEPPEPLSGLTAKDTPPHKTENPGDARINPVDWIKARNAEVGTGKARARI